MISIIVDISLKKADTFYAFFYVYYRKAFKNYIKKQNSLQMSEVFYKNFDYGHLIINEEKYIARKNKKNEKIEIIETYKVSEWFELTEDDEIQEPFKIMENYIFTAGVWTEIKK